MDGQIALLEDTTVYFMSVLNALGDIIDDFLILHDFVIIRFRVFLQFHLVG